MKILHVKFVGSASSVYEQRAHTHIPARSYHQSTEKRRFCQEIYLLAFKNIILLFI